MATQIDPLPTDPDMPSPYDVAPVVGVAEPHTWAELSETMNEVMSGSGGKSPLLESQLERILGDARAPLEKLRRIQRYVTDEIRYVGIGHGTSAVVPASVTKTLERRYADCKGKVALFLELAQLAGIDAWGVLVASERFDLEGLVVPSLQYFDHMIACARLGSHGDPLCTDLTDSSGKAGQLPASLYGAVALDLAAGTDAPRILDAPSFVWDFHAKTVNHIGCDGGITETLARRYSGAAAGVVRGLLTGMTRAERHRWAEESYREVFHVEELPTFEFEGLDSPDSNVVIHSTMVFPGVAAAEVREYAEPDAWLQQYSRWFSTENRHHPYWLDGARIRTSNAYKLCREHTAQFMGAALELESEYGSLRREYFNEGSTVRVETVFELERSKIEASQLSRYKRFLERSLSQSTIWFSFEER